MKRIAPWCLLLACCALASCSSSDEEPADDAGVEAVADAIKEKPAEEPAEEKAATDPLADASSDANSAGGKLDDLFGDLDDDSQKGGKSAADDDVTAEDTKSDDASTSSDIFAGFDDKPEQKPADKVEDAPATADPLGDLFGDEDPKADAVAGQPADPFVDDPVAAAPAPTKTVDDFFEVMWDGDVEKAQTFIFEPADARWKMMVPKQVDKMASEMRQGLMEIETVEHREQGDWALIVARIRLNRDGKSIHKVSDQYLLRTDDGWKMMPSTVREDSAAQSHLNDDFNQLVAWYNEHRPDLERRYLTQ